MKRNHAFFFIALTFIAEIALLFFFAFQDSDFRRDIIAVNEVLHSVQEDWGKMEDHINRTPMAYTVLDREGAVLFRTRDGLRESISQAVIYGDSVLDIEIDGNIVGKLIVSNNGVQIFQQQKHRILLALFLVILTQSGICLIYFLYLNHIFIRPFHKLKDFARRVAGGDLDIPLTMDRHNIFGAFTESFDLMRTQLKKARMAEAKANADKKELVAKLSHDIRTPVASIKATAEVGAALTDYLLPNHTFAEDSARERRSYSADQLIPEIRNHYIQIIRKTDQINALVTELFTATLEELRQLPVVPADFDSKELGGLLENSDYLHKGTIPPIPRCLLHGDRLRLQQVFDNIFGNSYKYAGTDIDITICRTGGLLAVIIEDHGKGVPEEELPLIKEKFRRGSNTENIDGAGLGLYISDYFMKEMHGALTVENGQNGLKVTVEIPLSGMSLHLLQI